jgi:ABC-type dipeptide/oligopeptide/nickel transport system ATPase component
MAVERLLEVDGLRVDLPDGRGGWNTVVDGVSFGIDRGERVGLVGSSGCGKSVTALAILGLVPGAGKIRGGTVSVNGRRAEEVPDLRGGVIGLVMQEGASALNPVFSVGFQLVEAIRAHRTAGRAEARRHAVGLLAEVALDEPERVVEAYPHQLSGGQAQRVCVALALAGEPEVLVADEPTTALDVVTQARVLDLVERITRERALGLLLVSHDLAVVSNQVDRVLVMDAGRIVEEGPTSLVLGSPGHPRTKQLVTAARNRQAAMAAQPPDGT